MHKRGIELIKKVTLMQKEIFSLDFIDEISKKTNFVKRASKLTAKDFISLCIFLSENMCTNSLVKICTMLETKTGISISAQALNKRFNKNSVQLMKEIFNEILIRQNKILKKEKENLKIHFNRIIATDATSFALPEEFKDNYRGCGGVASSSAVKIQLQYELLTGQFMHCEIQEGRKNDADYIPSMQENIVENDLKLSDLGYFKREYFKYIDENKAFYISKLKSSSALYEKNPNPEMHKNGRIKKETEYKKIDIEKLATNLSSGQTIELSDIYIRITRKKSLKTRLIITKLNEENKIKRQNKHKNEVSRGRGTDKKKQYGIL